MATIYDWATQASGTTIVGSLTATAAEYQGQVTLGTVTYGLIKYTFSGSPTLSSVIAGHRLTITGMTNSLNNASGLVVYSADDAADTITVRSTVRTDATADETGASGTGTVTTAGAAVQKPSDSYIEQGFAAPGKPSDAYWNWVISQMATVVQSIASRAANIYAGASYISSSSYADLDGAGLSYASSVDTASATYTPSANDGAYEDLDGSDHSFTTQANKVISILTGEVDAQASGLGPSSWRFDQSGTVSTFEIGSSVQQLDCSFSAVGVTGTLSAGTNPTKWQVIRNTGRTFSKLRSAAFELRPTDDNENSLIYYSNYPATQQNIPSTGVYTDITGHGTTQTWNSNTSVLILANIVQESSGVTSGGIKLVDGTAGDIAEWPITGQLLENGAGGPISVAHLYDLPASGSRELKLQGKASGNVISAQITDNASYFHAIELPDTFNGTSLMRSSSLVATDTTTSATEAEFATTGSVTTNGLFVVMHVSGMLTFDTADQSIYFQFNIDGSPVDDEYEIKLNDSAGGERIFKLMYVTEAAQTGSHTYSVGWRTTAATTATATDVQFAAYEMSQQDINTGNAPQVTLTNTTGKKVELMYSGKVNGSNAEVGFQITENIDGGGAVADGNEFLFTPQASEDEAFTFRTVVDAPASGSTAVYTLQGKIASGNTYVSNGDFTARELQADGS